MSNLGPLLDVQWRYQAAVEYLSPDVGSQAHASDMKSGIVACGRCISQDEAAVELPEGESLGLRAEPRGWS